MIMSRACVLRVDISVYHSIMSVCIITWIWDEENIPWPSPDAFIVIACCVNVWFLHHALQQMTDACMMILDASWFSSTSSMPKRNNDSKWYQCIEILAMILMAVSIPRAPGLASRETPGATPSIQGENLLYDKICVGHSLSDSWWYSPGVCPCWFPRTPASSQQYIIPSRRELVNLSLCVANTHLLRGTSKHPRFEPSLALCIARRTSIPEHVLGVCEVALLDLLLLRRLAVGTHRLLSGLAVLLVFHGQQLLGLFK